jgi:DNA-binding beta-propeller fold protein YncE
VESGNRRVQKFDSAGTFISKWGTLGTGDGQFNNPWGMCIDSSSNLYVADAINNRVQVFNSDGTFLYKWGTLGSGDGMMDYPIDIAITRP